MQVENMEAHEHKIKIVHITEFHWQFGLDLFYYTYHEVVRWMMEHCWMIRNPYYIVI
jgi:hypothetical protein